MNHQALLSPKPQDIWEKLIEEAQAGGLLPPRLATGIVPCYLDAICEVGGTTYIVSSHFKDEGAAAPDTIKRLINQNISE